MLIAIVCGQFSCKTAKAPVRPAAHYNTLKETEYSLINIPVNANIDHIEAALNKEMDLVFADNLGAFDMGGAEFDLKITKTEPMTIDIGTNEVTYKVPFNMTVGKDFRIAQLDADGAILLDFKTVYEILPDWSLATTTTLEHYHWTDKPVLSIGIFSLPIESVANRMVETSREEITKIIDQQVRENFVLKDYINEAWIRLQDPIPASIEDQLWVTMTPRTIAMTPLVKTGAKVSATIIVDAVAEAVVGNRPKAGEPIPLPNFTEAQSSDDDFSMRLFTVIPMDTARMMIAEHVVGETFSSGNRSVTVHDVDIFGKDHQIIVDMKMTGDYNGSIFIKGTPFYNKKNNRIEMDDVAYELATKNFLQKSMGWLFKKNMEKRMEEAMRFPLEENLAYIKTVLDKSLQHYQVTAGIVMQAELDNLEFGETYITPEFIHVEVRSKGKLNVVLEDLERLNEEW